MFTETSAFTYIKEALPDGPDLEMVPVKGGTFIMGNNHSQYGDEKPEHEVSVPDFLLGKYPVTNAQYAAFLQEYGSDTVKSGAYSGQKMIDPHSWGIDQIEGAWQAQPGFENHPVIRVGWYGAVAFCEWLSKKAGKPYRLPSEAEWEYAARGGWHKSPFEYAGSHRLKEVAWYEKNSGGSTQPVGLLLPNALGLYDMSGNVREWCADHWHGDYEGAPTDGSAWVTGGDASPRVVRGGTWFTTAADCRVSNRDGDFSGDRGNALGFRVSRYG